MKKNKPKMKGAIKMSDKTNKEILEQQYLTANDIQKIIPTMTYANALEYIKRIRSKMEEANCWIPNGKTLVALTWMVKKDLGIK